MINVATLSWAYIRRRPLTTALNLLLLALGIATITLLYGVTRQVEGRLQQDAAGIDLVVGAKGSPLQLILSGIYHLDVPTGNVRLADAQQLRAHPMVKQALFLSLGDSYRGFRIVGAEPEYVAHYGAVPESGGLWSKPMQVVLGAEVARQLGQRVGDRVVGSHGLTEGGGAHGDQPYEVVGILKPTGTVIDRLVLTSLASVWQVHAGHGTAPAATVRGHAHADDAHDEAHEAGEADVADPGREVTVVLIRYATPLAAAMLPRTVNGMTAMQAASPAFETARLLKLLGVGVDVLRGFAVILIVSAGLGVFISLYQAMRERRYDLAVMRSLGATRARLIGLMLTEGLSLALLGTMLGWLLGHLGTELLGRVMAASGQMAVSGLQAYPEEAWIVALAVAIGFVAALLPAWQVYRLDVGRTLAKG